MGTYINIPANADFIPPSCQRKLFECIIVKIEEVERQDGGMTSCTMVDSVSVSEN